MQHQGPSSPFVVHVACDFGRGKINTGIEFPQRPTSLSELVDVVEELYTAEMQLQMGSDAVSFHCAVLLQLVDVVADGPERKGRWVEILDMDQVPNGSQLFAFDSSCPPPTKGTIPKVQIVIQATQLRKYHEHHRPPPGGPLSSQQRSSSSMQRSGGGPSSMQYEPPLQGALNHTPNVATSGSGLYRSVSPPTQQHQQHTPGGFSRGSSRAHLPPGEASSSTAGAGDGTATNVLSSSRLPTATHFATASPEAREHLFSELCKASGSSEYTTAQRLHAVLAENGLVLSTEHFTEITQGELLIGREQWESIARDYAPLVDTLYTRLAAKAVQRNGEDSVQKQRQLLQALQDEEHRLLIRHATLRDEIARAARELREEEERVKSMETSDRIKDWAMVEKFIALKLRQNRLRREEAQINKELSLL